MKNLAFVSLPLVALTLAAAMPARAQSDIVTLVNTDTKAVAEYWTAERFKAATPLPMPLATDSNSKVEPSAPTGKVESADGQAPLLNVLPAEQQLFTPDPQVQRSGGGLLEPGAVGTLGAHFTSTRVFPMFTGSATPFSADRAYPHTTVGKLFFTIGRQDYVCSASVIQRRIVATAGHCVHSGTKAGFYSNWVFVPSFRDGTAPFLRWNWRAATVTSTWASGGGTVPNAADYAMIEFSDQPISPEGRPVRLGDITGWLGWQTLSLAANHTSKLGYPCNLDNCMKMQNVMSGAFRSGGSNTVQYGSDAAGGSSGGPWVQNFQTLQVGGGTGSNTGSNRVVGVTSYGYVSPAPKVQGASILDSRWVSLFNFLCGRVAGNCN
ncbi:trypsin-like serine peptidase [Massilia horti]|uniref:Trypsin-like serine protease n=1 Tax=Massilia horti TaxID=2562153 RepID=A0A4Y9SMD5_9BURK|nr:trypsin-like serine protease [Massilia horti]TFW27601.1 trypsin-like serine protease [Massilia horti]